MDRFSHPRLSPLGGSTRLQNIAVDYNHLREQDAGYPRTTITLTLTGKPHELLAAEKTIQKQAVRQAYHIGTYFKENVLYVSVEDDVKHGPVNVLDLVHKATRCDIGAWIQGETGHIILHAAKHNLLENNEESKPPRDWKNKNMFSPLATIAISHRDKPELQEIVATYIEWKLEELASTDDYKERYKTHGSDGVIRYEHDGKTYVSLSTHTKIRGNHRALVKADHLSEQISQELGVPEPPNRG